MHFYEAAEINGRGWSILCYVVVVVVMMTVMVGALPVVKQ